MEIEEIGYSEKGENMARLIDAEELFNKVGEIKPRNEEHYKTIGEFMNMITNSPTIESTTITTSTDEPVVINYPIIICDDVASREREAIINAIYKMELSNWVKDEIEKTIRELPPVESSKPCNSCKHWEDRCTWLPNRKGHWIVTPQGERCSNCMGEIRSLRDYEYCPNCGADMRGEE